MSELVGTPAVQDDLQYLINAATSFLSSGGVAGVLDGAISIEDALRQAYDLVNADLYVIDRMKQAKVEPDYLKLFGDQRDEKIASILFLTEHRLLAVADGASGEASHELAQYVEILFRIKASDGLVALYDFIASHEASTPSVPFWHNASARCLYLLSLLPESRDRVMDFLNERPAAVQRFQEMSVFQNPDIANRARVLLQAFHCRTSGSIILAPAPYMAIFERRYARAGQNTEELYDSMEQEIMEKVREALESDDIADVVETVAHGSLAEACEAIQAISAFATTELYTDVLEELLNSIGVDSVRLTAAVLELGRINRDSGIRGGTMRINHILHDMAMTVMEDCIAVARAAVRELATVKAVIDIERVMYESPFQAVAEEALHALKDCRVLSTHVNFLEDRPDLRTAFLAARAELLEIKGLMEAAYAAASEEIALNYLARLRQLRAVPELQKLSQGNSRISRMAQEMLAGLGRRHRETV